MCEKCVDFLIDKNGAHNEIAFSHNQHFHIFITRGKQKILKMAHFMNNKYAHIN
jgi:hypothetical protein